MNTACPPFMMKSQILDPDRGVHERYTPISHLDTSKVQNKVDASTHWMPDWLLHLFR